MAAYQELIFCKHPLRARGEIRCAKTVAEAPGLQGARKELARRPVTDEQRSKPGCIGDRTAQVISPRALSYKPALVFLFPAFADPLPA